VSRAAGRDLPDWHLGRLPQGLRDSVCHPLFALLYGGWLAEHVQQPTTAGQLVDYLVEKALGGAGSGGQGARGDLQRLAARVTSRGAPLPRSQVGGDLDQLVGTGLVEVSHLGLTLGLPVLTQWFAAQALGEGIVQAEDIAVSGEILTRWRYALQIFINVVPRERVSQVLQLLVQVDPGLVGLVVQDETPFASGRDAAWIPSAEAAGSAMRDAMQSWVTGIGPLARSIAPVDDRGKVLPIAVGLQGRALTSAWLDRGASRDIEVLRPDDLGFFGPRSVRWTHCRTAEPEGESYWQWKRTHDDLIGRLFSLLEDGTPLLGDGPLRREATWLAAGVLLGRHFNGLRVEPVTLDEIEQRISELPRDCDVIIGPAGRLDGALVLLRPEIERLRMQGETALRPPWPGPDRDLSAPGRHWVADCFSAEQVVRRVTEVFAAAMETYQAMCEGPFRSLAPRLSTFLMMPARLVGRVSVEESQDSHVPPFPSVHWYLEPLPAGSRNEIDLALGTQEATPESLGRLARQVSALRPAAADWIRIHSTGQLIDLTTATPLAETCYTWLRDDLSAIGWIPRSDPHVLLSTR
jgi:hypothetical protein